MALPLFVSLEAGLIAMMLFEPLRGFPEARTVSRFCLNAKLIPIQHRNAVGNDGSPWECSCNVAVSRSFGETPLADRFRSGLIYFLGSIQSAAGQFDSWVIRRVVLLVPGGLVLFRANGPAKIYDVSLSRDCCAELFDFASRRIQLAFGFPSF